MSENNTPVSLNCKYLSEGKCLLNRYENPTRHECANCMAAQENRQEGLGDTAALLINKTPLKRLEAPLRRLSKGKGCGCKKRQDRLNKAVNYGRTDKTEN